MRSQLTVVVAYTIATSPGQGGSTWAVLQYLLGLRRLGHRVIFVDPVAPTALVPAGHTLANSRNADYFRAVTNHFGFGETAALLNTGDPNDTVGLSYSQLATAMWEADVLINVSGVLRDETLLGLARRRVYLDLDPGFTQLWHEAQGIDMGFDRHTDFATIGLAIGSDTCVVPACGRSWTTTFQPVVLEHWPVAQVPHGGSITTIGNWRGYGSIEYRGVFYGQKAHSWRAFMTLPIRTTERIAAAVAIDAGETADLNAFAANRWTLVNPIEVAATPDKYQQFIQGSKAELGIAKSGYVASRTGWISDRSLCYLASGRPVLAQDTGFDGFLPVGRGLLPFNSMESLLHQMDELNGDYRGHARAARGLVEEHFDSDRVLRQLVSRLEL